jgi:hypothetical protein
MFKLRDTCFKDKSGTMIKNKYGNKYPNFFSPHLKLLNSKEYNLIYSVLKWLGKLLKACESVSGELGFKFWQGHLLPWPTIFCVFWIPAPEYQDSSYCTIFLGVSIYIPMHYLITLLPFGLIPSEILTTQLNK